MHTERAITWLRFATRILVSATALEENAMSKNGTQVVGASEAEVEAKADAQIAAKQDAESEPDTTHLIVELTQESYDVIKDVVDRATARGLDSTFEHWLNDAIKTGARARTRTWDDRDYVTLFKQATSPNAIIANAAKAKLAKMLQMNIAGTNPEL
jgi:hypothetical protein